jgi:hypothetical protein
MDSREMETLIQRLVANPHDEEALGYAHHAGTLDPRSYGLLLEQVGQRTPDPTYAAHWFSEAAAVWSTTLGDAHRAAHTLMIALDKDPTHRPSADRLAQLYREKGDQKALVALLERLVKALCPLANEAGDVRDQLLAMHDELGRLWGEPPLSRPERALENWRRLVELDPHNAYAIYAARELLKQQQQFAEAIPYFAMEQALVADPERKLALYRDEADVRRRAGDLAGVTAALLRARELQLEDVGLMQEVGVSVLDRLEAGESVPEAELAQAAGLFVSLAETYDGEYGLSYSVSALRAQPGNDRAMQLADHYAKQLQRTDDIAPQYLAYLQANPNGFMAAEARTHVSVLPPPAPLPATGGALPVDRATPAAAAPMAPSGLPFERPSSVSASPVSQPAERPSASAARRLPDPAPSAEAPAERVSASAASPLVNDLAALLEAAQSEAQKGRKPQAYAKYRDALKMDPGSPEALSWVEEYLRQKRMYADLRDVLLAASRAPSVSAETRKAQLRDVAGLCESQLRDLDTAIAAWKQLCQIDRGDEQARDQLRRLLERGSRWDDLATVLEQEAMSAPESEHKIGAEKKLAALHEQKRKDPIAAAEAWARIAELAPGDEDAVRKAVALYEQGERVDLAAQVIVDNLPSVGDAAPRADLLQKLGELRARFGDHAGSGEAYAEAADASGKADAWELAEKAFLAAGRFTDAANALDRRAELLEGKAQAAVLAQAADVLLLAHDARSAIARLERAAELDPTSDAYAQKLEELLRKEGREADLVAFLSARADRVPDAARRVEVRRAAATLQRTLGDLEGARETLLLLLNDGDDAVALATLVDDATARGDHQEALDLLRRLASATPGTDEKIALTLREGALLAEDLGDSDGAIERYEHVLRALAANCRPAIAAIAAIEEKRGDIARTAAALERELAMLDGDEKLDLARRLGALYEGPLNDPRAAIRALDVVHAADPEDFDALARLERLFESVEDWPRVAALSSMLIEVEGDEEEAARLTLRLARIQADRLGKGDEALATLERLADEGDEACREAYVELGDKLGWSGIVATKLVMWNESGAGPARNAALRAAFERFAAIGRDADAARIALELCRSRAADADLARHLEEIALRAKDLDALAVAHDLLASDLAGAARAAELVRQAEALVGAGVDPLEATRHGEVGLTAAAPADAGPLLERLAALTDAPGHVIDVYERQVGRCRVLADRLAALARAAQVAADLGATERARGFFELALGGGVQEDTIAALNAAAQANDARTGSKALRTILAEALAAGGQGSRDGGRTRSALLRRAASIAKSDLEDAARAFQWLGDAIVTHVDDASLDALEQLGRDTGDLARVEATIGRALDEVFDGPLVRKLLLRRAQLRRGVLGDARGAAADLKKLHDLAPADQDIMNELSGLLLELGDHRGMIQLYEDQILRGRDPALRADLARKVARLWEEELGDAREAADAWRRVLRMKSGDPEATQGLERAKSGKLNRAAPAPAVAPPPLDVAPPEDENTDTTDMGAGAPPAPSTEHAPAVTASIHEALPHDAAAHAPPAYEPPALAPFAAAAPAFDGALAQPSFDAIYAQPAAMSFDASAYAPVEPQAADDDPLARTDGFVQAPETDLMPLAPPALHDADAAAEDDVAELDETDLILETTGKFPTAPQ